MEPQEWHSDLARLYGNSIAKELELSQSCIKSLRSISGWSEFCQHNLGPTKLNSLHAKFFRGNKNIYLYFMSFLHIDMTQVFEILAQVRQESIYFTYNQYHG